MLATYAAVCAKGSTELNIRKGVIGTVRKKLTNVGCFFKDRDGHDPRTFSAKGRIGGQLGQCLKGIERVLPNVKRTRHALTIPKARQLLKYLHSVLGSKINKVDLNLFEALVLFGIWSLCRPGEFLAPTCTTFPSTKMSRASLRLSDTGFTICVPKSKTNNSPSEERPIYALDPSDPSLDMCPVAAINRHFRDTPKPKMGLDGPIFIRADGQFVTCGWLDKEFKKWTKAAGMGTGWSPYSLKKGGATSLAESGASKAFLKKAGRWVGDSYHFYIDKFSEKTHREQGQRMANLI